MFTQGQLVRSNQKDEYFLSKIRSEVAQLLQNISGIRWWLSYHRELEILVEVAYFALTTILGNQTLGEEYVNIVQVDDTGRRVPSILRRFVMVLLHSTGPYLTEKALLKMKKWIEDAPQFLRDHPNHRISVIGVLGHCGQLMDFIRRIHQATFFFQGKFYHISKRLTSIQYVLIRSWNGDNGSRWGYRVLGWLAFTQLAISCGILVNKLRRQMRSKAEDPSMIDAAKPYVESCLTCNLCLERRKFATATTCGHIFCWHCILRWMESKPQCPICREELKASQLIRLQNYD